MSVLSFNAMILCILLLLSGLVQAELSSSLQQQWAFNTSTGDSQKMATVLQVEFNTHLAEESYFTVISEFKYDFQKHLATAQERPPSYSSVNGPSWENGKAQLTVQELYLDSSWQQLQLRLGKQQLVWGEADGLKVLDKVNPSRFSEFILEDFDQSRIATWMLNAQWEVDDSSSLQLLWIPDSSYHEMPRAGSEYSFSNAATVPVPAPGVQLQLRSATKPDHWLTDSELGVKYTAFKNGWDISLNYLYHYRDFAVLYRQQQGNHLVISPEYQRSHLIGGSLSNTFAGVTLRAETGLDTASFFLRSDLIDSGITKSAELSSLIGLDWQGGDNRLSGQWLLSNILDYNSQIIRDQYEHTLSLSYQRDFANQTISFSTLALHSPTNNDGLIRPKLSYNLRSGFDLWLGADVFYGSKSGLYGQFKDRDRIYTGFEWSF
ncbi:MAG: hypothetical protein MJK13_08940 [Pseudomonadales bacterium]|nr:hypothetical protein [Pseudomonadales bacterium]